MKVNIKLVLKVAFLSTSLLLILPNVVREIPFAILGVFSIIFYFKEKIYKKRDFYLFIYFFVVTISLVYTDNLKYGLRYLEAQLPFFYLPFAYLVFNRRYIIDENTREKWVFLFNLSNSLFLFFFTFYFLFQIEEISYNNIRTFFDTIHLFGIHPIYLSIIAVLAFFSNLYLPNRCRFFQYAFICSNLILLLLTGVRSALLFFPFLLTLFFLVSKSGVFFKIKIGLLIFSIFSIFLFLNKDFSKRLAEITNPRTYNQIDLYNSASVRNSVWDCALIQAKQSNPYIGEGLGDTRGLLQGCYNSKYPELDKYYNTHNQYLSIYISVGAIGLIAFGLFLYEIFKTVTQRNKKYFLYTFVFYLYMFIFENVLERKYGILIFLAFMLLIFNSNYKINNDNNEK